MTTLFRHPPQTPMHIHIPSAKGSIGKDDNNIPLPSFNTSAPPPLAISNEAHKHFYFVHSIHTDIETDRHSFHSALPTQRSKTETDRQANGKFGLHIHTRTNARTYAWLGWHSLLARAACQLSPEVEGLAAGMSSYFKRDRERDSAG